jgi:hypothetical protein
MSSEAGRFGAELDGPRDVGPPGIVLVQSMGGSDALHHLGQVVVVILGLDDERAERAGGGDPEDRSTNGPTDGELSFQ